MAEADDKQVLRSYSMPAWLAGELQRSARMNDRSESAEMRVRLAGSFGRRADGSVIVCVAGETASGQQQEGGAA